MIFVFCANYSSHLCYLNVESPDSEQEMTILLVGQQAAEIILKIILPKYTRTFKVQNNIIKISTGQLVDKIYLS